MTRGLNTELRRLPDGAMAVSVEVSHFGGTKRHVGKVRVFWPLVTFEQRRGEYNITHALTGCWINDAKSFKSAVAMIRKLRRAADWEFVSIAGRKANRVRRSVQHLLPRLTRIS